MSRAISKQSVLRAVSPRVEPRPTLAGAVIGTLIAIADDQLVVRVPGTDSDLIARSTITLTAPAAEAAAARRASVVLLFEGQDPARPVVTGIVQERAVLPDVVSAPAEGTRELSATIDGRRVVLEAKEEIVLQCGEASITLRHNGRLIIRGTHVESRAVAVNRIRGGSVKIN